jgi:hypothetical protein
MKKLLLLLAASLITPATVSTVSANDKPTKVPKFTEVPNKKALQRWLAKTPSRASMNVDALRQAAADPLKKLQMASANATVKAQDFKCALLNRSTWDEDYPPYGAYSFSTADLSSFSRLYVNMDAPANAGGFFTEDKYYFTSYVTDEWGWDYSVTTYIINTTTWKKEATVDQGSMYAMAYDLAYDPIEKVAYGSFYDGSEDGSSWGYMDLDGEVHQVADLEDDVLVAVAATKLGQIYAITDKGFLVTVDKATGKLTQIGYTRLTPSTSVRQSAAFASDGTLYWAVGQDSGTGLVTVNTETGEASLVGEFENYEIVAALYAELAAADEGAPSEATDLVLNFVNDALTGEVSFGVPTQNNLGETITGNVTYIISVDGTDVVSGQAAAGETASAQITVDNAGNHIVAVRLQNENGDSQALAQTQWIGIDRPEAVSNLMLEKTSPLQATISWSAPAKGAQGGYFDVARVRYDVVRMPEGKVVAEKIADTTFVDNLESDGKVYLTYKVIPFADDAEGVAAVSNGIIFGNSLNVPVSFSFKEEATFNIFTVVDNNQNADESDGKWMFSSGLVAYSCGTRDGDDWLITPEINLKADRQYIFSYQTLCYSNSWPDKYEVYMGKEATAEAMTVQLVAPTELYWEDYRTTIVVVTVPEDGTYNFGFHALSEAGGAFFVIDDIAVTEGLMLKAPDPAENLKVVADAQGAPSAKVSFTTPSKAVDGSDLTALSSIKIYRGAEVVKEFTAPAIGAELSFEESGLEESAYTTYEVVAATEAGVSVAAADSAWVGEDMPSEPVVHMSVANGHPVLTWDAPSGRGQHGGYFDNTAVSYRVYSVAANEIITDGLLTTNTFTDESRTLSDEGDQALYEYGVYAVNEVGYSYPGSAIVLDGAKYELPFKESFTNGSSDKLILINTNGDASTGYDKWGLDDDYNTSSQDGDGGSIMIMPATVGVQSNIQMGKIDMTEAKNSTLTFYVKRMNYDTDYLETNPEDDHLDVYIGDENYETTLVKSIRPCDLNGNSQYEKFTVSLAPYEGQNFIFLQFKMVADAAYYAVVLDNIQVRSNYNVNLQATEFSVPASVDVTRDFEAAVTVKNDATEAANGYTVAIKLGNEVIASQTETEALESEASRTYTFSLNALAAWADTVKFVAEVSIDNDEVAEDNTLEAELKIERPEVDGATNLTVELTGADATFAWTAPTVAAVDRVTESFESYTHGARKDFGEWKVIDEDGAYGCNADIEIPGYFSSRAFTVINSVDVDADGYEAKSGNQLVAAFSNWDNENDDWLVSPKLSSEAQTVSFWARSTKASTDKIYFYYSTNGTETDDFLGSPALDERKIILTTTWKQYTFELPAGAKYFAIRYLTDYGEVALIDDIEFDKAATYNVKPVIEGYNLYLDGKKVNDELISDTTYTALNVQSGKYYVTVVYNVGETAASNEVTVETSLTGIESIKNDAAAERIYDIYGRNVNKTQNGKLYLRNGEKFIYQQR